MARTRSEAALQNNARAEANIAFRLARQITAGEVARRLRAEAEGAGVECDVTAEEVLAWCELDEAPPEWAEALVVVEEDLVRTARRRLAVGRREVVPYYSEERPAPGLEELAHSRRGGA